MANDDVDRRKRDLARALRSRAAELDERTGGPEGGPGRIPASGVPVGHARRQSTVPFFASAELRRALLAPTAATPG